MEGSRHCRSPSTPLLQREERQNMKAVIASDLAPMKIGSCENQLFTAARFLEREGIAVTTSFAGSISDAVRDHFGLNSKRVHCQLGSPTNRGSRVRWLRHLKEEEADIVWLHFFPPTGPFLAQIRWACPRATIYFSDHISRG